MRKAEPRQGAHPERGQGRAPQHPVEQAGRQTAGNQAIADPAQAFALYTRAKLEYTRKNVAESRLFASEIIQGARFLKKKDRDHMRRVTDEHVAVVEGWIADGKMVSVDARHLFIMLWAATQFYADFEPVAADGLRRSRLKGEDYEAAAVTITETILSGILPRAAA